MIVHVGWDTAVTLSRVLMVMSAKCANASQETGEWLERARREGRFTPCPEREQAYIILHDGDDRDVRVVASAISPATLHRRMEQGVGRGRGRQ